MRIQNKLFLTLSLTCLIVAVILVLLMQWSVGRGMIDYVNKRDLEKLQPLISDLAMQYGQHKNWQWLRSNPLLLRQMMFENLLFRRHDDHCDQDDKDCQDNSPPPIPKRRPDIVIMDSIGNTIVAIKPHAKDRTRLPIVWQSETVGWVSIPHFKAISDGFELVFLQQQRKAFFVISIIVMAIAALVAFLLARHFVKPIERLTQGANQLTQGDYGIQLPSKRNDELGQLARDFNELARTLEKNESSRKRWLADISHELRTPLTILGGEIEAMLDGIRPLSTAGIQSMKEEVDHLNKLVNDLYELTKADIGGLSYRKEELDLVELVQHKLNAYVSIFEEHKLKLRFDTADSIPLLWADRTRLNQLLDNLLTNVCRYTSEQGEVHVAVHYEKQHISLLIEDTPPGVPDEALEQLFDYLYRTEHSRNRESGGSGLGLAICKRIVEGHGGSISAAHSSLGGVAISVLFPV